MTSEALGVTLDPPALVPDLPPGHAQRDTAFFPDWFLLTRCQALAISNSTFAFTAAMANDTAALLVRPAPAARGLVPFDPWDSELLLFLPAARTLVSDMLERLALAHRGLGRSAWGQNLRGARRWYLAALRMRARACRHYQGRSGLWRELLRPGFYRAPARRYDTGGATLPEADLPALPAVRSPVPRRAERRISP